MHGASVSSMMSKKELLPRCPWTVSFRREDRTESRQEPEPVPSSPGMRDIAAGPLSPVANDPSALPTVYDLSHSSE